MKIEKTASIAIILILATSLSLAALPSVNAQEILMNLGGPFVELGSTNYDIDLNGGVGYDSQISLMAKWPGRTFFTVFDTYFLASGSDLDVYNFNFNETGVYSFKWAILADGIESNVQSVECVLEIPPYEYVSHIYGDWSPSTIGVGQEVLIVFWSNWIPQTAQGAYGDRWQFTITVTDPEGSNETLGPITSDPVGGGYTYYTPTMEGTYTMVAHFPTTVLTGEPGRTNDPDVGNIALGGDSEPAYLTVVAEQVPRFVETPLPDGYWTRPIHGNNREWTAVAGNWLGSYAMQDGSTDSVNAYSDGPESAHILWSKPYWSGGVADGFLGDIDYYGGQSYERYSGPEIILDGKIHYDVDQPPRIGRYIVDLYTGETMSYENTTGYTSSGGFSYSGSVPYGDFAFGQVLDIETPNQHGAFSYLWVTDNGESHQWDMYSAHTGKWICSIENVDDRGTMFRDDIGSICYIDFDNLGTSRNPNYYMHVWNTTHAIYWEPRYGAYPPMSPTYGFAGETGGSLPPGNSYWMWRPELYGTYDGAETGYSLNVSVADIRGPRNSVLNQTGEIYEVRDGEYVIIGTEGRNDGRGIAPGFLRAISLERPTWGSTLWDITFTPPKASDEDPSRTYLGYQVNSAVQLFQVSPEDDVFVFGERITRKYYGYSLTTGQQIWETEPQGQWNYYGLSNSIYQGKLLGCGYAGVLDAWNLTTGEHLWNWTAPVEGFGESWYTHTPLSMGCFADGKVYLYTSEHSPNTPYRRDANIWCVDTETGEMLWKIQCWPSTRGPIVADGRLIIWDAMDNSMYCIGKGPSATTVMASPSVSVHGDSVIVQGTVTDQSPSGRRNINDGLDFTLKGTPAISDEDMEAWMEYMYQQRPYPADAKGVEVVLTVLDPNNNVYEIGTATSDTSGNFAYSFEPLVPGDYQIVASFDGSKSYGPSHATTYITVQEAPTATAMPTPPPASVADMYFLPVSAVIIVAIVVIGIVLILMLRKR